MSKALRRFFFNDKNVIFEFIYPQKHEAPRLRLTVTNNSENISFVKTNFNLNIGNSNPNDISNINREELLIEEINDYRIVLKIIDAILYKNNNEKLLFIRMQCQRKVFEMKWQSDNLRPVLSTLKKINTFDKLEDANFIALKNILGSLNKKISAHPTGISYAESLFIQYQILDHVFESKIDNELKYKICPQLLEFEKNRDGFIARFDKLDTRSEKPKQENEDVEHDKNQKPEITLDDVKNKIRPQIDFLRDLTIKPSAAKKHLYNITQICSDRENKKLIRRYSYFYEFTAFLYKMLKLFKLDSDSLRGKGRRFLFYVARVDQENVNRVFTPHRSLKR